MITNNLFVLCVGDEENRLIYNILKQVIDLQEKFETLQRTHDEEMGEMVDAVNDLREKEEELQKVLEKLDEATSELEKSKQEMARMEEKHQVSTI